MLIITPHVAFDRFTEAGDRIIYHAYKQGGTWVVDDIYCGYDVVGSPSIDYFDNATHIVFTIGWDIYDFDVSTGILTNISNTQEFARFPQIVDNIVVFAESTATEQEYDIMYAYFTGGEWSVPEELVNTIENSKYPQIAVVDDPEPNYKNIYCIWTEGNTQPYELRYRKIRQFISPLGCPFVSVFNGIEYEEDNNILSPGDEIATDYYLLTKKPVPIDGVYKVKVHENGYEHSYFDMVRLYQINHEYGTYIGVTPTGDIFQYREGLSPAFCYDNHGNDWLAKISLCDGDEFIGNPFDTLYIGFTGEFSDFIGTEFHNAIAPGPMLPAPGKFIVFGFSSWRGKTLFWRPEAYQRENPSPHWATKKLDRIPDTVIIVLTHDKPFRVDYVTLFEPETTGFYINECELKSAQHSISGNVGYLLAQYDSTYAELLPGEEIEFEFIANPKDGYEAEFGIVTIGRYFTERSPEELTHQTIVDIGQIKRYGDDKFRLILESARKSMSNSVQYFEDGWHISRAKTFDEERKACLELKGASVYAYKNQINNYSVINEALNKTAKEITYVAELLALVGIREAQEAGIDEHRIDRAIEFIKKGRLAYNTQDKLLGKLGIEWYEYEQAINRFKTVSYTHLTLPTKA